MALTVVSITGVVGSHGHRHHLSNGWYIDSHLRRSDSHAGNHYEAWAPPGNYLAGADSLGALLASLGVRIQRDAGQGAFDFEGSATTG